MILFIEKNFLDGDLSRGNLSFSCPGLRRFVFIKMNFLNDDCSCGNLSFSSLGCSALRIITSSTVICLAATGVFFSPGLRRAISFIGTNFLHGDFSCGHKSFSSLGLKCTICLIQKKNLSFHFGCGSCAAALPQPCGSCAAAVRQLYGGAAATHNSQLKLLGPWCT